MKFRLKDMFPGIQFKVIGEPADIGAARQLQQKAAISFNGGRYHLFQEQCHLVDKMAAGRVKRALTKELMAFLPLSTMQVQKQSVHSYK